MRPGGGKAKGAAFERKVCELLSLWVTHGENADVFWRSAMSGGRATVAKKRGQVVRQAGDVCAVASEGHVLTDTWYIEIKHYRDLQIPQFVIKGTGTLAQFWRKAVVEAAHYKKMPMLIARQNGLPTMIVVPGHGVSVSPRAKVGFYDGTGESAGIYQLDEYLRWHEPLSYVGVRSTRKKIARVR